MERKQSSPQSTSFNGKLIIVTAPSGAGKTTIVRHLLQSIDTLAFSVAATTRKGRAHEIDGKDYYFISPEDFRERINQKAFIEWEEVYDNQFYGTLRSEVDRLWAAQKHIIFDIDVRGAINIKNNHPENSLAIFIKPPSAEVLFSRLRNRQTEDEDSLRKRIARAKNELTYENKFDKVVVNDILEDALKEAKKIVEAFIEP